MSTMLSKKELEIGSRYLRYYIRMYVKTFLYLDTHKRTSHWNTSRNAILEAHLMYARALINFLIGKKIDKYPKDIYASDFFYYSFTPTPTYPITNSKLDEYFYKISGWIIHITAKPLGKLKSEQIFEIGEIANCLIPDLNRFFSNVHENHLAKNVKRDCEKFLLEIPIVEKKSNIDSPAT